MAEQVQTPFEAWKFTEEEEAVAMVFMPLQEKHIRTELAIVATERMNLAVEPDGVNPQFKFMLESEYLRGKLDILHYLLAMSEERRNSLYQRLVEQTTSQQGE